MASLVPTILRWAVGGIFVLAGTTKVFPFTAQMAQDNLAQFTEFATVYPTVPLGYQPSPQFYLNALGSLEIALGLGFLFAPGVYKKGCCLGLMFIMTGGIQTLLCLKQPALALIPASFFGALCYVWRDLNKDSGNTGEKTD